MYFSENMDGDNLYIMMVRTSCINTVYTWICWNLFWLLKITSNNRNTYSHRRGNHIISNLSNMLLIEALVVAWIIIPALFICMLNNFSPVRRITPQNYLIFNCKVKKSQFILLWRARESTTKAETRFKFQWFLQYRYTGYI